VVEKTEIAVHQEGVARVVNFYRRQHLTDKRKIEGHAGDGGDFIPDDDRHGVGDELLPRFGAGEIPPIGTPRVERRPEPRGRGLLPVDELGGGKLFAVHEHVERVLVFPLETHAEDLLDAEDLRAEYHEEAARFDGLHSQIGDELPVLACELPDHDVGHVGVEHRRSEPGAHKRGKRLQYAVETVEDRVQFVRKSVGYGDFIVVHHPARVVARNLHGVKSYAAD